MQAFFIPTTEKHSGDIDSFLKATKKGMIREGGKNVKIIKKEHLELEGAFKILKCEATFTSEGNPHKSLFYIMPLDGMYHMITVTVTSPNYFDSIASRADRLFSNAQIKR